jgi:hypothetical protein
VRARTVSLRGISAGALVLGAAVPPLFLHVRYQPSVALAVGGASVDLRISDLAVLAIVVAAAASAARQGWEPLHAGRVTLAVALGFVAWVGIATLYGPLIDDRYPFTTNAVTAAKFAWYALLAPAAVLLLRRREDVRAFLFGVVGWSVVASAVGFLQLLGLIDEFEGRRPGQRETSWLGVHDFAALSGASMAIAVVAIAYGNERRGDLPARAAGIAGGAGLVVAAALNQVAALAAGVAAVIGFRRGRVSPRRVAALAAIVVVVGGGAVALRAGDLGDLLRLVGIGDEPDKPATQVETFTHRSVLFYLGVRIALDHPLLGVGWQGSALQHNVEPFLDDARRRFPDAAPEAFPSEEHPWGVQNAFVQAAADLGVLGALLFLGLFAAGLAAAVPVALGRRGSDPRLGAIAALWLVVAAAALAFYGLYAGVPVDALLWLAVGLAVASRRV